MLECKKTSGEFEIMSEVCKDPSAWFEGITLGVDIILVVQEGTTWFDAGCPAVA